MSRVRCVTSLLVVLLFTAGVVDSVVQKLLCCDPPSGASEATVAQYENCKCLNDDVPREDESLVAGELATFHWKLSDYSWIEMNDNDRPKIQFRLTPCSGYGDMYVQPLRTPWPTNSSHRWNASYVSEEARLEVQVFYADYFVSVHALTDMTFTIAAVQPELAALSYGGDGSIHVDQVSEFGLQIKFNTTDLDGCKYQIYYKAHPKDTGDSDPCGEDLAPNPDCIMRTGCGAERNGVPVFERFKRLDASSEVAEEVEGLENGVQYFFNVVVEYPNGYRIAYLGAVGTPTYSRVTQAVGDNVTYIIAGTAGGIFFTIIVIIVYMRRRLDRSYKAKLYKKKR